MLAIPVAEDKHRQYSTTRTLIFSLITHTHFYLDVGESGGGDRHRQYSTTMTLIFSLSHHSLSHSLLSRCWRVRRRKTSTDNIRQLRPGAAAQAHQGTTPLYHYRWYLCTECPKIYRKSVLHLLKYTENLYLSRCSTDLR